MTNLEATIDALGALKAQMAELEKQEKALRENLKDLEPGAYEGSVYRLQVIEAERSTLDTALIRKLLSEETIEEISKKTMVRTMKFSALGSAK